MADIFWVEDESIPDEKDDRGRSNNLIFDFGGEDYYTGFWDFCECKWWCYELEDWIDFETVVRWCDPTKRKNETTW